MTETTAAVESSSSTQTCKNCGNEFAGNFCNRCGEKVYGDHDKSIFHFLEDGIHFITHFDGTLINSVRTIFGRPGQLSVDYSNGIRKRYFRPLALFMLLVVLYLIFPMFTGLNMPMRFHLTQDFYGDLAQEKAQHYIQSHHVTMVQLEQKFAAKSEKTSKFMLFAIIPLSAIPLYLFGWKKRRYFFDHLLLSTEINSFYLIYAFFLLPLSLSLLSLIQQVMHIKFMGWVDEDMLGLIISVGLALFVSGAFKRFFGFKWWVRFLAIIVFIIAHYFIVYSIYKFLLFITVMALI
jgi:hypothetical protein